MSLDWDVSKCENSDELTAGDQWEFTQAMVFATIGVGIGAVTEANWQEFYARMKLGYYWNDAEITPDVVRRYIGMRTNVSFETRAKWLKRVMGSRLDEYVYQANRVKESL